MIMRWAMDGNGLAPDNRFGANAEALLEGQARTYASAFGAIPSPTARRTLN